MTDGRTIRQIMAEQRQLTHDRISRLDCADRDKEDMIALLSRLIDTANQFVQEKDSVMDSRVLLTTLILMLDEFSRVNRGLEEKGLRPETND